MLLADAVKYRDVLGSWRYFLISALPSSEGFSLAIFDPGPPGSEYAVLEQVKNYERYIRKTLNSRILDVHVFLTHTHPTTAGSVGWLYEALMKQGYDVLVHAHVRSIPLVERDKSPEDRAKVRFERETHKRLRLFNAHSPPIYRPYYTRVLMRYKLPRIMDPLIPSKRDPETVIGERKRIDVADVRLERMRSSGHSYEHVVYRIEYEDFRALIIGDEGPAIMGDMRIRYNDATSRMNALKLIEKRQEAIFGDRDEAWVFRTHGAMKVSKDFRIGNLNNFLDTLKDYIITEFGNIEEIVRMRVSDSAAAMLIRDKIAEYIGPAKYRIGKTHYINAENLPLFTMRAALVYVNGRGTLRKIFTRNIDPAGRYRYIEVQ